MSIEKKLERSLREGIRAKGGMAIKLWSLSFTGLPDRLILLPGGRLDFIEVKDTGEHPSPRQLVVHRQLRELGFNVYTISTELALFNYLKSIQP